MVVGKQYLIKKSLSISAVAIGMDVGDSVGRLQKTSRTANSDPGGRREKARDTAVKVPQVHGKSSLSM